MRSESDTLYVLGLCDALLGQQGKRGHRFDFLRGDAGHRLPVDTYYQNLHLVVEYRERQQSEIVVALNKQSKLGCLPRESSRSRYAQRRRDVLTEHGIELIEIDYKDFQSDWRMQLKRIPTDIDVVRGILAQAKVFRKAIVGVSDTIDAKSS